MALKATIFKVELQVADMDRSYYADHALTIARHPSETDERMMVRVLAFALHAGPDLAFGKGCRPTTSLTSGSATSPARSSAWIDVGLPDERLCARPADARATSSSTRTAAAGPVVERARGPLERARNLRVSSVPVARARISPS